MHDGSRFLIDEIANLPSSKGELFDSVKLAQLTPGKANSMYGRPAHRDARSGNGDTLVNFLP